jgi:hypothetical protein
MHEQKIVLNAATLEPFCEIAGILGMEPSKYIQRHLEGYVDQIRAEGLVFVAEEVEAGAYRDREVAEAIAQRFEEFAIEGKLAGRANIGTISTRIEQQPDRYWAIKTDHLGPSGKWRSLSVHEE